MNGYIRKRISLNNAVVNTKLGDKKPDYKGKVRDIYDLGEMLLIVTTDRISAFDVVLPTPIPGRGIILNKLSAYWFKLTEDIIPNHVITSDIDIINRNIKLDNTDDFKDRSMLVRKARRFDIECIVRGYITGSGWQDYKRNGSICGIKLPNGLKESEKLSEPIFTPSTKAEDGTHDENITYDQMIKLIGKVMSKEIKDVSIELYNFGYSFALKRGIIISDTKFEFGLIDGELTLIDEILTPDSSRFWDGAIYKPGIPQDSMDKQIIRDYLHSIGWKGEDTPPELSEEIVSKTYDRYLQVYNILTS